MRATDADNESDTHGGARRERLGAKRKLRVYAHAAGALGVAVSADDATGCGGDSVIIWGAILGGEPARRQRRSCERTPVATSAAR